MPFQRDEEYATEVGSVFGEYLATFVSEPRGQVRADIFRKEGASRLTSPSRLASTQAT